MQTSTNGENKAVSQNILQRIWIYILNTNDTQLEWMITKGTKSVLNVLQIIKSKILTSQFPHAFKPFINGQDLEFCDIHTIFYFKVSWQPLNIPMYTYLLNIQT